MIVMYKNAIQRIMCVVYLHSIGEDDMAFVYDYDALDISIANDVITLPSRCEVKERLAVSFAVAQSTILSIFEARVENKIEEYKFIPETLATSGKVELSTKQLGVMIGKRISAMMRMRIMVTMCDFDAVNDISHMFV